MLILKNGKIFTMEDDLVHYGDILIDGGKIVQVDHNLQIQGAKIIDLHNQIVMPGLIDCCSQIGLIESGRKFEGDDRDERFLTVIPGMRACDGVYSWDKCFDDAIKAGVTTSVVSSGNLNVVGCQSSAIKTKCGPMDKMLLEPFVDLHGVLGDEPKKWNQGRQESPLSRMGIAQLLRSTLNDAGKYMEKTQNGSIDHSSFDPGLEAIVRVLKKECPLKVTAHKVQDIFTAIRIKNEFDIEVIVDYGTESHLAVRELLEARVPVILGSCLTDKSSPELVNRRDDCGRILSSNGICTIISTHHPDVPAELLLLSAAVGVKEGMSYKEALKAITINPAKCLGLDNRIGSIREGKDADIVVFNGDPMKSMSKATLVLVDGEIVYEQ